MGKKKKFVIDLETIGLNGPGMLKDIDIRNAINVADEIKEQLKVEGIRAMDISAIPPGYFDMNFTNFRPSGQGDLPKSVDLMKFMEDFYGGMVVIPHNTNHDGRTIYNEEDLYKGAMHDKTSDDFINGEVKHMLWGKHHYDDKTTDLVDGAYYWVQVENEGEWEMGRLNTRHEGNYHFTLLDLYEVADYDMVNDFQLIDKPE